MFEIVRKRRRRRRGGGRKKKEKEKEKRMSLKAFNIFKDGGQNLNS